MLKIQCRVIVLITIGRSLAAGGFPGVF